MKSKTEDSRFHAGLTPDDVVDAALAMTTASNLWGWSIRDLARTLGVSPSVIYHHVGGKDLLARRVVERSLAGLAVPDEALTWQDWFRSLLSTLPAIAEGCPGAAKWLMLHGPTFPSVIPILDAGMRALRRAGFGDDTPLAYTALLNNAVLTLSIIDERRIHADDGPRDHAAMMAEFRRAGEGSLGVAELSRALMEPLMQGGEIAAAGQRRYYDFIVETTIAGLEAHLERRTSGS